MADASFSFSHSRLARVNGRITAEAICEESRWFRITKDVSLLRVNHSAIPTILFGVWEIVKRRSSGAQRCKAMVSREINRGDKYALDNFRGAFDFVASGFQPSRGWRSNPLAAGRRVSGLSN